MRLPNAGHESRPWRIREIAPDFTLEDVWALPVHGGAGDFPELLTVMASRDLAREASPVTRLLFGARLLLGRWFGWDGGAERPIPGRDEASLAERLPDDLRGTAADLRLGSPFSPLYRTDTEFAAELSNQTVHGVMHLAWVDRGHGRYQGQMAVYVKPRGRPGNSTWHSSRRSGTGWSIRPCCARSNGRGRRASRSRYWRVEAGLSVPHESIQVHPAMMVRPRSPVIPITRRPVNRQIDRPAGGH